MHRLTRLETTALFLAPTLRVGATPLPLRGLKGHAGRRAAELGFPREAWEPGPGLPRFLSSGCCLLALVMAAAPILSAAEPLAFLVGEDSLPARLASIDTQWNISFRTGDKVRVVPARDLAYWGRYRDAEAGPQILLRDGSLIRADVLKLDDKSLILGDATGLGRGLWEESTIPRPAVHGVLYQPPASAAERDRHFYQMIDDRSGEDRLLLVGGESVGGVLVAAPQDGRFLPENAKPGQGTFELSRPGQSQPLSVPAAKVMAIQFGTIVPPSRFDQRSVWLGVDDGSLVCVSSLRVANDKVYLELAAGGTLVASLAGRADPDAKFWDEVNYLQSAGPQVVWLSDVKTLGYKHIPYLSIQWPYQNDRSVTATRLRSGSAVFPKGLGMHTTSRLAYDVAGFRKFEAEIALDASAGDRGSVIFRVLLQDADGAWTPAYESTVVRGGDDPVPISVDLKAAGRMALIVEFADRGDELDHANWFQARVIK